MTSAKLLVLAIDAASPELLERWAADGTLPHLRTLMARGLIGTTRNVDGFCIGATWPSWYTGLTPARHGLHYIVQLKPGTYELYRPSTEGLVKRDAFWSHLSRAGRRVAVLDVPVSAIDRSLNGIQTVEWGGHDVLFGLQSHPTDLADRIVARFGTHPLKTECDAIGRGVEDYQQFLARLVAGVRAKTDWTLDLLERSEWDFFVQVFTEAHCVGHQCWHLHDAEHPAHDARVASEIGDPLRAVYQAIDAGIGRILAKAENTRVLLVSLHGMSHAFGGQFLLRDMLVQLGVTEPLSSSNNGNATGSWPTDALRAVWRQLPQPMRERLAPIRHRVVRPRDAAPLRLSVDARRSQCFPHNNGLAVGGIRINLAGRETEGVVNNADRVEEQLISDLLDVVDERTQRPLIRRILRTREHYSGEHLEALPDLLIEWDDTTPLGSAAIGSGIGATIRARSPKLGTIAGTNYYGRTGEHRPNGFFVAAGPNAGSGRLSRAVSILDFAPTFANRFGVALPECDGAPIPELLDVWR